ncbi:TraR/DksA family transcriptional regulator [Halomonas sp. GXIMD04776]|uniref:TraR/DksA family transcriptional regulator n=1 Tax=Halomonas sp. GXIMD04776 TaxID=3415605 RepID=UPI003CA24996
MSIDQDTLRQRLKAEREQLLADADSRDEASATVELDQSRTGRLSRMDALQGQAMAQASDARAQARLALIQAALTRIEEDDYGECLECGEMIAEGRLAADPAITLCIDCASHRERSSHPSTRRS